MTTPTDPRTDHTIDGDVPDRSDTAAERAHLEEERRVRAVQQSDDPGQIRDEIRMTRGRMDDTLYELEDRVAPSRVAERGKARLRSRWTDLRTSVMGTTDHGSSGHPGMDTGSSGRGVGDTASDAADKVRQAPRAATRRTRGNPLAAGMIAFGVGALAAALLPESDREQHLVEDAADKVDLEQVRGDVERAAREVQDPVRERAQDGLDDLKGTATDHAREMKDEAASSGQQVRSDAQDATDEVSDHASDA